MRGVLLPLLLPFTAWLAALQALHLGTTLEQSGRVIGLAGLLGTLTVLIYRLGVWRQEMENTKYNVGAELKSYRQESSINFERIERRLEALDHLVTAASAYGQRAARWQSRTDQRLERVERARESELHRSQGERVR